MSWVFFGARKGCGAPPKIKFLGIFDTVASFGVPGNRVDIGVKMNIPRNVEIVRHATSKDESRQLFPLRSVLRKDGRIGSSSLADTIEKEFKGVHSDIGGGYNDQDDLAIEMDV